MIAVVALAPLNKWDGGVLRKDSSGVVTRTCEQSTADPLRWYTSACRMYDMKFIVETRGRKSRRNPAPTFSRSALFCELYASAEAAEKAVAKTGYGADGGEYRVIAVES